MIDPEQVARIRHLFHAEHWKIGTIAEHLGLHWETVRQALATDRFNRYKVERARLTDPYLDFIRETLARYPRLRATRLYEMLRTRGYIGSVSQLRRLVGTLRPSYREAFLRLRTFPGEQGQVDWAHFGQVRVGQAQRKLSCFVFTLSYSRALYLEFFFDQRVENFLCGHVHAFQDLGCPRALLYDNCRSVVLERRGEAIHFHPRLLELAAHYHFAPHPCQVARGNQKGRVEKAIQYIRHAFFAARPFSTLEDFNRQALVWRNDIAHRRPCPQHDSKTVQEVWQEERAFLLPAPAHPFETDLVLPVSSAKTIYIRFDLNDYSLPPTAVGRPLTLVASAKRVRILEGTRELASHPRSYDRHQVVSDPAHEAALLEEKRKALGATPSTRLLAAVPETEALLDAAFQRGESPWRQTKKLLELLDLYGPLELRGAVGEALERGTPRASSVAFLLARRHRSLGRKTPLPIDLHHRPELADLYVQTPDPEIYDELSKNDEEP
ncbi:MAG: IS21 family transposase [Deltaproteobacteria bacterium]|nr:IS21 family transposase [Deltaproteobacteria bacterium]